MARWPGRNSGGGGYDEGGFSDARRRFLKSDNPLDLSFPLFRFLGVLVRIHILFVLFLVVELLMAWSRGSLRFESIMLAILFGIVLLHEYGHCLACRWVGGEADEVILWPLGGLAMCRPPRTWKAHFVTTAGGPLVNVLLVPVSMGLVWLSVGHWSADYFFFNPFASSLPVITLGDWWAVTAWYFYYVNLALLLFNVLLIMFPMDGGRLLQAVLWSRIGYRASMRIAVNIGLVLAVLVGLFGMTTQQGMLTAIAVFCAVTCWVERSRLNFAAAADLEEDPYGLFRRAEERGDALGDGAAEEKRREKQRHEREAAQAELDRILAKIASTGMGSLSARERKFLQADTQRRRGA